MRLISPSYHIITSHHDQPKKYKEITPTQQNNKSEICNSGICKNQQKLKHELAALSKEVEEKQNYPWNKAKLEAAHRMTDTPEIIVKDIVNKIDKSEQKWRKHFKVRENLKYSRQVKNNQHKYQYIHITYLKIVIKKALYKRVRLWIYILKGHTRSHKKMTKNK